MFVPPLRFFLQRHYTPAGVVEEVGEGVSAALTPAYVEWGLQLTGVDDVTAVLYQFPASNQVDLVGACLDEAMTPLFRALTGPDYGEPLTALVATQWPDFYGLLAHSNEDTPGRRKLCRLITNEKTQWIVADEVSGDQRRALSSAHATSLIGTALETFHKATHPYELEHIIDVYAGPDRRTRRLNAVAGLLKAAPDIIEVLTSDLSALNVLELFGIVGDVAEHIKELKR